MTVKIESGIVSGGNCGNIKIKTGAEQFYFSCMYCEDDFCIIYGYIRREFSTNRSMDCAFFEKATPLKKLVKRLNENDC